MIRIYRTVATIVAACAVAAPASARVAVPRARAGTSGWIGVPAAAAPVVLQFRRSLTLRTRPKAFPVRVSADNRFILYVNGRRVAAGPSTSDLAHWRYTTVDLAPALRAGSNMITATVWNAVKPTAPVPADASPAAQGKAFMVEMMAQTGRLAQQSKATGFWLDGDGARGVIATRRPGWAVAVDPGRTMRSGASQLGLSRYYVAGAPEIIDTAATITPGDDAWRPAVSVDRSAARRLTADPLPAQSYAEISSGTVVRSTIDAGGFPARAVTIPARTKATILLRRDAMVSAYPELRLIGGQGARVTLEYAEALYDADGHKGDRDAVGDRRLLGVRDEILADGRSHAVMPLWWRTWRYLEIAVDTKDAPVTLTGLRTWETGYPFVEHGYFRSDDPALDRIWQVGWRTARVDAHDTYMDSSYWEQLQYVGDTRLQILLSYAVSGDARLARQAIDAFAASDADGGLIEGAWPSRGSNAIAPFALLWIGMLHDWRAEQPETAPIVRHLPRMRRVLDWFARWQGSRGLLLTNSQWNFIDWVGQGAGDRTKFPSYGAAGESCLTSVSYLGALQQAGGLEAALGDKQLAQADSIRAQRLRNAIRTHCYDTARGLFADNPDRTVFSQQMNALAILYDVATPDEAGALFDRIVAPGKGIDAPAGMYTSSYYFAWYLVRAMEHAGLSARYPALLQTWRDLLKLNFTTWPEERGDTRSDTHAWSAHPTADLLRLVAGIGPAAPGYARVRIAPQLGELTRLDAAAMTPCGLVAVRYRVAAGRLHATIMRPHTLPGWLEWRGRRYPLAGRRTTFDLPLIRETRLR